MSNRDEPTRAGDAVEVSDAVEVIEVIDTSWIELAGRPRLAARIWLPSRARAVPVPAILEFLPYRRRDSTAARDESTYPALARAGYAGIRVDMRGTGDSDGTYDDEYSETELADAEAVIGWIAEQSWCTGAVGMMGISWGGFNALQVAARRPPALRAVISIASSVDRYNDDIHYRNGCNLGAHLAWSTTVMAYIARPPDSDVVGEPWRDMWLDRLAAIEPPVLTWMAHQRRDSFWQRGSIADDFTAVSAPALVIAGWADGYRNTPAKAVAGMPSTAKALNGPWIHRYPHFALPRPRVDFHAEAVRWWDRWLRGVDNGAEDLPRQRAFIAESLRPGESTDRVAGRWVARDLVDGDTTTIRRYLAIGSALIAQPSSTVAVVVDTAETCGADAGGFFVTAPAIELPGDQRDDDAASVVFDSDELDHPIDVLGRTRLSLEVTVDQPQANLVARLIDVHPDGVTHLVALGVLNLSHRHGNELPEPMTPGRTEVVELLLDDTGYRFAAGHRMRLAISTAYFPMILPPPHHVRAIITLGENTYIDLSTPIDLVDIDMPEPAEGLLPVYEQPTPGFEHRTVTRSADGRSVTTAVVSDSGELVHPTYGMIWRETHDSTSTIEASDPTSLVCIERVTVMRRRGGIETTAVARATLTATTEAWCIRADLTAFEDGLSVFERTWDQQIERDLQ